MNATLLAGAQVAPAATEVGTAEAVLFWVLAPILVVAASGLLFVKRAVHAALLLALVMIGLAVFYLAQGADFLGVAQIVVYTGAVMMLFLFVLMLVGVDASDSLVETIRNHRWPSLLAGLGLGAALVGMVTGLSVGPVQLESPAVPAPAGLEAANADGNPVAVARVVFSDFVLAFELTGALLVTAAVGAIVLTNRERLVPRTTQRTLSEQRVRQGTQVAPLPSSGVFARHNAVDTPALLPDGTASELSVSRVLRARGQDRSVGRWTGDVAVVEAEIGPDRRRGVTGSQFPTDEAVDGTGDVSDVRAAPPVVRTEPEEEQ